MRQVVAIRLLLLGRVSGDDVDREAAPDQRRERIELLDERHGADEARAVRDDELDGARSLTESERQEDRVRLRPAEVSEQPFDARVLSRAAEARLLIEIAKAGLVQAGRPRARRAA